MKKTNRLFLSIIVTMLTACASQPSRNLEALYLYGDPSVTAYQDPTVDFDRLRTFSVLPIEVLDKARSKDPILETQVMFFVQGLFEQKGYRNVSNPSDADFIVTMDFSSKYKEHYVPPVTLMVPKWVPGQTETIYRRGSGTAYGSITGDVNASVWGNSSGTSTETRTSSGYLTSEAMTMPGRTVGRFYPGVGIFVYESKSGRRIWHGSSVGTSDQSDFRIGGQFPTSWLVGKFPNPRYRYDLEIPPQAWLEISFASFTLDGNNYFPAVIQPRKDSALDRAGIWNEDLILEVNGITTLNKTHTQIMKLLIGSPGDDVTLKIWRKGESFIRKVRLDGKPRS